MSTGTLLFSGTDLASVCIVEDLSDFWSSSDVRGDLPTFPGVRGALPVDRPVSSKTASGQVTVADDTLADIEDGVAAVKAILREGVPQTVTRRKVTGAGNLDATQTVIVRSVAERWIGDAACTLLIGAELCDGLWHGPATLISPGAGTHTILGDTRTTRMTITLDAGSGSRSVVNSTNGFYVSFDTSVPTGGVLIDVEAQTATAITGGADMSSHLLWGKRALFQLEAGSNVLGTDNGTFTVSYQPAYL